MLDLLIIGAGPAGLAAAIYGKRAGLNLVVTEGKGVGGQVLYTYEVDNYPGLPGQSGQELVDKMKDHADGLDVEFVGKQVKTLEKTPDGFLAKGRNWEAEAKAVLVATGAEHRKLGCPGEEENAGRGVSYCATCDGAFYKEKTVAVVGGGDVALEDAIYLARACKKVYVILRRDAFRGSRHLQEQLMALSNVEVLYNREVKCIQGGDSKPNGFAGIKGLELIPTGAGDGAPIEQLKADGVFIAVGIEPVGHLLKDFEVLGPDGYALAGENGATKVPGLYVAGDIRKKPLRQIITAVADGANAATAISEYIAT